MVDIGVVRVDFENLPVDRLRLSHLSRLVQPNPFLNQLRKVARLDTARSFSRALRRMAAPVLGSLSLKFILLTFC
jgi:hypothetical protein